MSIFKLGRPGQSGRRLQDMTVFSDCWLSAADGATVTAYPGVLQLAVNSGSVVTFSGVKRWRFSSGSGSLNWCFWRLVALNNVNNYKISAEFNDLGGNLAVLFGRMAASGTATSWEGLKFYISTVTAGARYRYSLGCSNQNGAGISPTVFAVEFFDRPTGEGLNLPAGTLTLDMKGSAVTFGVQIPSLGIVAQHTQIIPDFLANPVAGVGAISQSSQPRYVGCVSVSKLD